jgi:NADH-quinone oxidoreductase subunit N
MLFKLGAFPFHSWLCDVYEGTSLNITAFFSTVPKIILLCFFIKVVFMTFFGKPKFFCFLILASGLGSVCFASLAALYQKRIKRLMTYSTISHTGFLLLSVYCLSIDSIKACNIYIFLYIMSSMLFFCVLFLSGINNNTQKYLVNWSSLFERNSFIAIVFALILFSTAGIPPLAGFYSKFCVLICLTSENLVFVLLVLAVFSSISCFYYIRFIKILFFSSAYKTKYWFGAGTKNIEIFIGSFFTFVLLFLLRPNLLITCSSIAAISLI